MPRRRQPIEADQVYHLTNQGHNRTNIYISDDNFRFFMDRLSIYVLGTHAELFAFALMPNHYHLLARVLTDDFVEAYRRFSISYTKSFNSVFDRVGTLYRGRFTARLILGDADLQAVSRYIHINPVKDGFVSRPDEWVFSSYADYVTGSGSGLANPRPVLSGFGNLATPQGLKHARQAYRQYVTEWRRAEH